MNIEWQIGTLALFTSKADNENHTNRTTDTKFHKTKLTRRGWPQNDKNNSTVTISNPRSFARNTRTQFSDQCRQNINLCQFWLTQIRWAVAAIFCSAADSCAPKLKFSRETLSVSLSKNILVCKNAIT